MKIVDLTHEINPEMTIYPGTSAPKISPMDTYDEFGVYVQQYSFNGHIGTHLDVPKHILERGETTSSRDINSYIGEGVVIDCSIKEKGELINLEDLSKYGDLSSLKFILFYTGWSKFWNTKEYCDQYPVVSTELSKMLSNLDIFGVGFDTISIDKIDGVLVNHHYMLSNGKIVIENLANLDLLLGKKFIFSALPLKFTEGDGSPIRAVAIIN